MTDLEKLEDAVELSLGTKFVTCVTCKHYHLEYADWGADRARCKASPNPTRINPVSGKTEYEVRPNDWTDYNTNLNKYKYANTINPCGFCSKWEHDPHKNLRKIVKRTVIVSIVLAIVGIIIFLVATHCDCPKG